MDITKWHTSPQKDFIYGWEERMILCLWLMPTEQSRKPNADKPYSEELGYNYGLSFQLLCSTLAPLTEEAKVNTY